MQIDRSPSRGPYVAALVCLFVLCLIVPVYWQSGNGRKHDAERARDEYGATGSLPRIELYSSLYNRRPGCWDYGPDQTLDELLREAANRQVQTTIDDDLFTQYLTIPAEEDAQAAFANLPPYVTDLFYRAGHEIARGPALQISPLVEHFLERVSGPVLPTDRTTRFWRRNTDERLSLISPALDVEAFDSPWCLPTLLLERLEVLAGHPYSSEWAFDAIDQLRPLTEKKHLRSEEVAARLMRLEVLAVEAIDLAEATRDDRMRVELLRAHWSLSRRIHCWALMRDITVASVAANRFAARLPWEATPDPMFGQGTTPVDLHALSSQLEEYERTRTPQVARAIVERQRLLAASANVRQQQLADQIEENYRNANVRFAISAAMLERFVEQPEPQFSAVRDRIAGTPVRGSSQTFADNNVRLKPDDARWHMELESQGTVQSNTVANGGQARVRSSSTTQFTAEKTIVVEQNGVHVGTAKANAQTCGRLMGIETDFDWMPLLNDMVHDRAIQEYRAKRLRAAAEVEYKVARRVESQLDQRAGEAVEGMEHNIRSRFTGPMESAGVVWTPIQLSTTPDRIVARLRVAGDDQLAGHTPRPRAPSDSLASLQLHESALTNMARALELDGKRLSAPELQAWMRQKLARSPQPSTIGVKSDTVFEFADHDAVRVRMADEKLEVILSLAEVNFERDLVRDFRVHAFYQPVIQGVEAEFVRDGALGIEGRLGTGDRARMHGVFNKVLSEDRRLPIVRLNDPADPRLKGLMITQLVLEDGWMGMAIGPEQPNRTAERSRMLR